MKEMKRGFLFASCLSLALLAFGATQESSLKDGIVWYFTTANSQVTLQRLTTGACIDATTSGVINVPRTLKSVKVTTIGAGAFTNCTYLTAVNLPATVTKIEAGAFAGCTRLKSILIGADSITIASSALAKCPALTDFATTSTTYTVVSGVLYNADQTQLIRCPPARLDVDIPASVAKLAADSFAYSSLTNLVLPAGLATIPSTAFTQATSLQQFAIGDDAVSFSTRSGLLYDKAGQVLRLCPSGRETLVIPSETTSIASDALLACSKLRSITFPATLTSLGSGLLVNTKNLQEMTFEGDAPENFTATGLTTMPSVHIRYNRKHADSWVPVLQAAGCQNTEPYTVIQQGFLLMYR